MAASFLGASLWMTPLGGDDVHQHNHLWKRVYPIRLSYTILCLDLREHRRQTSWPLRRLSKRLLQFYLRLSWLPKRQSLRHPHSWAYGIIRGPELRRGFCLFFDWKRSIIFNEKNSIVHNQLQYQITCQDDPKSLGMLLFSKKFRANSRKSVPFFSPAYTSKIRADWIVAFHHCYLVANIHQDTCLTSSILLCTFPYSVQRR